MAGTKLFRRAGIDAARPLYSPRKGAWPSTAIFTIRSPMVTQMLVGEWEREEPARDRRKQETCHQRWTVDISMEASRETRTEINSPSASDIVRRACVGCLTLAYLYRVCECERNNLSINGLVMDLPPWMDSASSCLSLSVCVYLSLSLCSCQSLRVSPQIRIDLMPAINRSLTEMSGNQI